VAVKLEIKVSVVVSIVFKESGILYQEDESRGHQKRHDTLIQVKSSPFSQWWQVKRFHQMSTREKINNPTTIV